MQEPYLFGRSRGKLDLTKFLLVFLHIVLQGIYQALGVIGAGDDPGPHFAPGILGLDIDEVHGELGFGVVDHCQVDINALGHFLVHLDLDVHLLFFRQLGHWLPP
jgi:hypothetical protein